jgi:ATP-dependent DNA ligase
VRLPLRSRSCIIDGEAVACGDDGIAVFERIRYRRYDASAFLYAFHLLELNGDDLRREPLEWRKATLARLLLGQVTACGSVPPEGGANTCAYSSSTSSSASSSALWARRPMRSCRTAGPQEEVLEEAPAGEK